MITEDYVSFETAKLLKEKSFDCCCRVWYAEYTSQYGTEKYISIEFDNHNKFDENHKFVCFVPTLQMAMKWLRKVHNIDIDIKSYWKIKPKYHIHGYKYRLHYNNAPNHDINQSFNSYEEACEAAIKYCLENLI